MFVLYAKLHQNQRTIGIEGEIKAIINTKMNSARVYVP